MKRVIIIGVAAVLLALVIGSYFLWRAETSPSLEPVPGSEASQDLGITYLPLTPGLSAYYGLGVESGALVTEVVPSSPADRAGIRAGDIILSFNGDSVEKENPLLGMIRACPADSDIVMEVCRGQSLRMIQLAQTR